MNIKYLVIGKRRRTGEGTKWSMLIAVFKEDFVRYSPTRSPERNAKGATFWFFTELPLSFPFPLIQLLLFKVSPAESCFVASTAIAFALQSNFFCFSALTVDVSRFEITHCVFSLACKHRGLLTTSNFCHLIIPFQAKSVLPWSNIKR